MKRYEIKTVNIDNKDICIVFSTSYLSPLKFIPDIEKELSTLYNYEIEVIFDFFLSNGNTSERYGKVCYNGINFISNTFKYIKVEKNDVLRRLSAQYYRDAKEVDFSFLNNVQKKMIINGIAI